MTSRKPIFILMVLTGSYSIFYILSIIFTSIITGEYPSIQHTHIQLFGILFIFSVGILSGGMYLSYFFPELREKMHGGAISSNATPYEVLAYISTPEEINVIETIRSLSPHAYKFEIARKTGLSRMKVHRIVQRLAERGIAIIERSGRYSKIHLADWLN